MKSVKNLFQLSPPNAVRQRVFLGLCVLSPLFFGGCAAFNYSAGDKPVALSTVEPFSPRPKVALVLGSGGPRGYAHVGVLRVLEEAGIVPDIIVGSSVGALIGAFWANGLSAAQIDEISMRGGPLTLFDPSLFADRGWIHGQKLQDYVNDGLMGRKLEELPRRVAVVATRRDDKQPRVFISGNTGVAVRASSAIPGVISPVGIDGVEYEDGDESLPVPVSVARAAGASFIIAVDVSALPGSTPPEASERLRARDTRRRALIAPEVAKADFLIHPDLGYWASPRRSYFVESRVRGEATARAVLPLLRAKLSQHLAQP